MQTLKIETTKPYDVIIGKNILKNIGKELKSRFNQCSIALVTDDIVNNLYGETVKEQLIASGFTVNTFVFPNGEKSKNMATFSEILEFFATNQVTRSDLAIALGGGVVGDITGFAAATYLRGIDYIQIPTTFLAAIDSSVGGKTAINLHSGKNLAGAFHQPSLVYCDYETMKTLPFARFGDGIAEALKYGILQDKKLFDTIAKNDIWENMEEIIVTSLKIKRDLVLTDEFDKGQRQLLNLGHTIGHAIEKESDFTITHGHAISIGMVLIAKIAAAHNTLQEDCITTIIKALNRYDLPTTCPYKMETLIETIKQDKKRKGDTITFIMPQKIGHCILQPINIDELRTFLNVEEEK